jgi:hypothetical protein
LGDGVGFAAAVAWTKRAFPVNLSLELAAALRILPHFSNFIRDYPWALYLSVF